MASFIAVGDIALGLGVVDKIKKHGPEYPFKHVAKILSSADITFGNLEGALTNEDQRAVWDYTKILDEPINVEGKTFGNSVYLKSIPEAVGGLKYSGFDVLSIANNHIMDYGAAGLEETIRVLDENDIKHVGAGMNLSKAREPVIIQAKDVRVGFLGYCDVYVADKGRPGTAPTKYVQEDIKKVLEDVDVLVISIHGGMDIVEYPLPNEVETMRRMIDLGADLVIRHHPHVMQGVEKYKNGAIVYSPGNFVFDYTGDHLWKDMTKGRENIIFKCELSKEGVTDIECIPTIINSEFQPQLAEGEEKARLIEYVKRISEGIGKNADSPEVKKIEADYAKIQTAIGMKVMWTSLKKGRYKNILLMMQRVRPYHLKLLLKHAASKIIPLRKKG